MANDASGVARPSRRALGAGPALALSAIAALTLAAVAAAQDRPPFSFSKDAEKEQAAEQADAAKVAELVSVPCQQRIKDRKILLLLAERTEQQVETSSETYVGRRGAYQRTDTAFLASQDRYGPHIRAIETRLRALGLRPYTQEQIRAQVAQAEIDAYFRNDPDAALAASRRLAADYVLRGEISTLTARNDIVGVDEVTVNFDLALTDARTGRLLSAVDSKSESFSGTDTLGTALALVRKQADPLVAQVYNDFCRNAGAGAK
jgi:hypothetical protein